MKDINIDGNKDIRSSSGQWVPVIRPSSTLDPARWRSRVEESASTAVWPTFRRVFEAYAVEPDLTMLPNGDGNEIGEKVSSSSDEFHSN